MFCPPLVCPWTPVPRPPVGFCEGRGCKYDVQMSARSTLGPYPEVDCGSGIRSTFESRGIRRTARRGGAVSFRPPRGRLSSVDWRAFQSAHSGARLNRSTFGRFVDGLLRVCERGFCSNTGCTLWGELSGTRCCIFSLRKRRAAADGLRRLPSPPAVFEGPHLSALLPTFVISGFSGSGHCRVWDTARARPGHRRPADTAGQRAAGPACLPSACSCVRTIPRWSKCVEALCPKHTTLIKENSLLETREASPEPAGGMVSRACPTQGRHGPPVRKQTNKQTNEDVRSILPSHLRAAGEVGAGTTGVASAPWTSLPASTARLASWSLRNGIWVQMSASPSSLPGRPPPPCVEATPGARASPAVDHQLATARDVT